MTYCIRWRFSADVPKVHSSEPIRSKDLAIHNACVLLRVKIHELWIEDSEGHRIEIGEIERNCAHFARLREAG